MFSAVSQRLRRPDRSSPWLAVGEASLAVDPVSGSGVVRALRSARAGAETALAILDGRAHAIAEYEADRDVECTAPTCTNACTTTASRGAGRDIRSGSDDRPPGNGRSFAGLLI